MQHSPDRFVHTGATYDPHNNKYDSVHIDLDAFIEP
jgi:hypothetical protein